jgi:TonB family protein
MNKRHTFALFCLLAILAFAPRQVRAQDSADGARKIVFKVAPQYPNTARNIGLEGSVKADVLVAPNGTVKSVEVKGGHPLLALAAQGALHQWKWQPATHESHESVELKFNLHDSR